MVLLVMVGVPNYENDEKRWELMNREDKGEEEEHRTLKKNSKKMTI